MPKELRVHGVSGTPPTELLYTDPVTYDQGWDLAKVYERTRDGWEVSTGPGHSRYELTPEFCAARKAFVTGDLSRPGDPDMAGCWEDRR